MAEISLASSDVLVAVLAAQRGLLDPARLDELTDEVLEQRAQGRSASLLGLLVDKGLISPGQAGELKRLRAEHGRRCGACGETTYLLPGELQEHKTCEQCQGPLTPDPASAPTRLERHDPASAPTRLEGHDPASAPTRREGPPASAEKGASGRLIGRDAAHPIPAPPPPRRPSERLPGVAPAASRPAAASSPAAAASSPAAAAGGGGAAAAAAPAAFAPPPRFGPPPEALAGVAGPAPPPPRPLWAQVGEIVAFPFLSREGVAMTCLGGLFALVAQFIPAILWPAFIPMLGWIWSYFAAVTNAAMQGEKELPAFPDMDLVSLFGMFFTVLGVCVACYWPIAVTGLAVAVDPVLLPAWLVVMFCISIFGTLYFPLAWLMVTAFRNVSMAFAYRVGLRAALAAPGDYVLLLVLAFAVTVTIGVLQILAAVLPVGVSTVATALIGFYGNLVLATAVGRFYQANAAAIGWFSVRTAPVPSAPAPRARPATQRPPAAPPSAASAPPAHAASASPPAAPPPAEHAAAHAPAGSPGPVMAHPHPATGPRAPVASWGAVRSARGEAITSDALKADALHLVKHPATIVAVLALAVILVIKSFAHQDWYVTVQEASRVSRERNVPLVIWRHGAADRTKEDFPQQVLRNKVLTVYEFVVYEHEVPGAPDTGTPAELTVFKPDGTQVAYFRPADPGFTPLVLADAVKTAAGR